MESETTEILHCPFCGSRCAARGPASSRWVFCTDDDVCGYVGTEGPDAIAAHNTVAAAVRDHAALTAERDALRAQVGELLEIGARLADFAWQYSDTSDGHEEADVALADWHAVLAATAPGEEPTDVQ